MHIYIYIYIHIHIVSQTFNTERRDMESCAGGNGRVWAQDMYYCLFVCGYIYIYTYIYIYIYIYIYTACLSAGIHALISGHFVHLVNNQAIFVAVFPAAMISVAANLAYNVRYSHH